MAPTRSTWIARVRRLHRALRESSELHAEFRDREQRALIGLAMAWSGRLPRGALRTKARHVTARHFLHLDELDAGQLGDVRIEGLEHLEAAVQGGGGAIVAPFHFGAFRLIAPLLLSRGFRVALLATRAATAHLTDSLPAAFAHYLRGAASDGRADPAEVAEHYLPIDSTSPTALWKLRGALKDGRVVVLYPDGNTGMGDSHPDASCPIVPFFDRPIAVRTGIASLAAAADRPIVPTFACESTGETQVVRFEAPLRKAPNERAAAFRTRAMEALFARLEVEVRRVPERWEQWPYVWRWTDRTPVPIATAPDAPVLDLRAIGGQRLRLKNPYLWAVGLAGTVHVLDLRTWHSLGSSPALITLLEAAEREESVDEWLTRVPRGAVVAPLVATMIAMGGVEIG